MQLKKIIFAALIAVAATFGAMAQGNRIYTIADTVDRPAQFPGGEGPMMDYINLHIPNHEAAGYDQPVYCTFLIMPYGEIDYGSIEFMRKQPDGTLVETRELTAYEKAVRNAIEEIPGFIAAEVDGDRVPYLFALPINCKLEDMASVKAPTIKAAATATAAERAAYTAGTRNTMKRDDGVYTMWDRVDDRPEFPGGRKQLYKALHANLKKPHIYSHQKDIYCSFVILPNGQIDKNTIKCLHKKGPGHYIDAPQYTTWEKCVMESVAQMPDFVPAKLNGQSVPYEYVLPVHFK